MQDNADIAALEQRISLAFERIARALDRLPTDEGAAAELAVEREANAQLAERLRTVKEREAEGRAALEARVAELTRQVDAQGIELQRLKKTAVQLRETLRSQTDALAAGTADPHLINRAMLTELEALRALRQAEVVEIEAILAALAPLVETAAEEPSNA